MWKPRIYLWLEIIVNFLYILGVSPFKVIYNNEKDSYILYSNGLHKLFTAIAHTFGILYTIIGLYSSASRLSLQNPKCIFHSAVAYSRYIIYYTLLFSFWIRRSHFVNFFSSTSLVITGHHFSKKGEGTPKDDGKVKLFTWIICILMVPSSVGIEIINNTGITGLNEYITRTYNKEVVNILQMTGMGKPMTLNNDLSANMSFVDLTDMEYGITVAYDIVAIYVRTCNHIAVMLCLFAGVTMYHAASTFVSSVEQDRDQSRVIEKYVDFCKFGCAVNKMCGLVVLGTVVCSPPFFVVYFIGTFTNWEDTGSRVVFYSAMYCFLYVIAAEAASKIGEFKEWIIEYGEGDNESQMFAMFVEISQSPMGLRGLQCFTITYGFLSKMFAIVVTFTIILLQFETTPQSSMTSSTCR